MDPLKIGACQFLRRDLSACKKFVRLLNAYITSLINLRDDIEASDRQAVTERLTDSLQGRARWFDERLAAEWLQVQGQAVDAPTFGERMNQMFFGGMITDRQKQRK